jgi:hypothetical protein
MQRRRSLVHSYEARKVRVVKGFCVLPFGVFYLKAPPFLAFLLSGFKSRNISKEHWIGHYPSINPIPKQLYCSLRRSRIPFQKCALILLSYTFMITNIN